MGNNLLKMKKCKMDKCPEFTSAQNSLYCTFHQSKRTITIKKDGREYILENSGETLDKLVECINDIYSRLGDAAPEWDIIDSDLTSNGSSSSIASVSTPASASISTPASIV